LARARDL